MSVGHVSHTSTPSVLPSAYNPPPSAGSAGSSGVDATHDPKSITFADPVDTSSSLPSLKKSEGLEHPGVDNPMEIMFQIIQLLMMLMQLLQEKLGGKDSGESGVGGADGASASGGGGGGGGGGDKGMSVDANGNLEIGEKWGGWDGVAAGDNGSSHDVEDRAALQGVLTGSYGLTGGEAEQVTMALHSAARGAGLDADKGVHSNEEAAQIKEQNHANIKDVFAQAGPGAGVNDFLRAIDSVY